MFSTSGPTAILLRPKNDRLSAMIAALNGKLLRKQGETLIIDVHGVGYEVTVSSSVVGRAGAENSPISVLVHTDVKENSISLFGFSEPLEKEVFLLLKKVKGIGSRLAISVVSAVGAEGLLAAIGRGDVSALRRVPGIGKKTAERLIVELRDIVGSLAAEIPPDAVAGLEMAAASPLDGMLASKLPQIGVDAALALERLGFPMDRALKAVSQALKHAETGERGDAGELVKLALANL